MREIYFYVEDNVKLSSRLKANIGLHLGYYSVANNTSTNNIGLFEKISDKSNLSLQPRLSTQVFVKRKLVN